MAMSSSSFLSLILRFHVFLFCKVILAEVDLGAGGDLMSFVTRPEIRAPRFDVKIHHEDLVSPGYWLVAPYSVIDPEAPTEKWTPCQIGPHIYDGDGTLIWSGACLFENRNIFDFRPVDNIDDETHLSFIVQHGYHDNSVVKGSGMILDQHYEHKNEAPVTNDLAAFNMHEFKVLDGGKTALACEYRSEPVDFADMGRPGEKGWVVVGGFEEIDTATGEVLFEWKSKDHVSLSESTFEVPDKPPGAPAAAWDYIHVNSVDKNSNGDYLLSARFTNTIYLVSGEDGHIIWRLGGKNSDFTLGNFSFYRQHHVQFVSSNDNQTIISFLNNASDEISQEDSTSAALIVELNTAASPMTARVINRYPRPDGELSRLRGSVQILSNPNGKGDGNIFVGWSQQGYQSEFTPDGTCVMEARFISPRFSTYRSYKLSSNNFHGRPTEPPAVKTFVYGPTTQTSTTLSTVTVFYVSWNGATDVSSWNFYAQGSDSSTRVLVGNASKSGFETVFIADGYLDWVSVEALDAKGTSLGTSEIQRTTVPETWTASGFSASPDDPASLSELDDYLVDETQEEDEEDDTPYGIFGGIGGFLVFLLLIACSISGVVVDLWLGYIRRKRLENQNDIQCENGEQRYTEVPSEEEEESFPLGELSVSSTPIT